MARRDLVDDGRPLAVLRLVDLVVLIRADHRLVGGDLDDLELVDLHELGGLGEGRAGHAAELVVAAEVVLVGDRRDRLVLLLDRDALLGLDGLVEPLRPAAALEDAAGELVDDLDLVVDHLVLDAALVERLGLERLDQVVDEVAVLGQEHVLDPEELLGLLHPALGDRDRLVLLVRLVVEVGDVLLRLRLEALGLLARLEHRGQLRELVVEVGRLLGGARDDQRRARLVDEDVVDLVDDRERVAALDLVLELDGEVVAQVVEAELRVGAVGDVGGVLGALLGGHAVVGLEDADGHAERVVDRLHPLGVAAGEVVVDGDEVDGVARERVQHHRERGGERLALAGLHLGDRAVVQDHAADQLHVEVAHAHRAPARLAGHGEALEQQVVERLAVAGALAQAVRLLEQLVVRHQLHLGLEAVDARDVLLERLELLPLAYAQSAVNNRHRNRG